MAEGLDAALPSQEDREVQQHRPKLEATGGGPSSPPTLASPDAAQAAPDTTTKQQHEHTNKSAGLDAAHGSATKSFDSSKVREALTREMYRIPGYAGWFSWGKIHAIERRALAEFFDGRSLSKTPKVYKEYRDFIINKYRENPRRFLTFTEVRKMLVGDVNLIRKVFDCIEHWGLINHHTLPESKQQAATAESALSSATSETIPPGVRIVYPCTTVGTSRKGIPMAPNGKPAGMVPSSNLASYRDTFAKSVAIDAPSVAVDESTDKSTTFSCSNCGADCMEKRFENTKKAGFVLCQICFSTGDIFLKDDFISKETNVESQLPHEDWTRQEVLCLLEAIAKYGENWDQVALHVGTKSKTECIMHFMKLPFGDQFLISNVGASTPDLMATSDITMDAPMKGVNAEQKDSNNGADATELHDSNEHLESVEDAGGPPLKRKRLTPFADASNTILAQVAFLSAMTGPRVAAAAAQAALLALAEEDPIASQFLSSAQPVPKDPLLTSGSQPASKENVKAEDEQREDAPLCKEEHVHLPKEAETETTPSKDPLPSVTQIRAGIATAIGVVAANAKLLADQEEREIEHLMASIIENQLKKLDSKVEHFEELELLLEREHLQVERAQAQVLADWIRFSHYNYNAGPG